MLHTSNIVFSIVITTHNRPQFLSRALQSVMQQGYQHWEVLIVDDGSQPPYLQDYVEIFNDPRIQGWELSHQGVNAARNWGIQKAKGDFVLFLDDDDQYLPMHLEVLYDKIKKYHPRYKIFKTAMKAMRPHKGFELENLKSTDPLLEMYLQGENLLSFAFSKEIFQDLTFITTPLLASDQLFLMEAVLAHPLKIVEVPTVVYHHNPQGLSKRYCQTSLQWGEQFFDHASAPLHLALRMRLGFHYQDYYWGKYYLHHARLAIRQGERKIYFQLLRKAWRFRLLTPWQDYLRTLYTPLRP
jgi:glycosyltransferase involved in cell wall biosynthesis